METLNFEQEFGTTPPPKGDADFERLPAGRYIVDVAEAEYRPATDKYGANVNFKLVVAEGEHTKRIVFFSNYIGGKSTQFLQQNLMKLGLNPNPKSEDELKQVLEGAVLKRVPATIKYTANKNNPDKPYTNVYFGDAEELAATSGDIPF